MNLPAFTKSPAQILYERRWDWWQKRLSGLKPGVYTTTIASVGPVAVFAYILDDQHVFVRTDADQVLLLSEDHFHPVRSRYSVRRGQKLTYTVELVTVTFKENDQMVVKTIPQIVSASITE